MIVRWLALFVVLLAGTANAQPVGVEIVQYGLYRSDVVDKQRDVAGVTHNVIDNICHLATTEVVPMKIGVHFGVRYKVTGPVAGQRVLLKKVLRYPTVMASPTRSASSMVVNFVELPVGTTSYTEYALEQPWELASGAWTFQFFERDRMLAEFRFTVAEDATVAESNEPICFQLSS
ncbi:MAG: DUF3859 domain-containing protein [Reyranella sp.]|nr:DUF3859 domain-containing protein [Reyranella sp.]